jgi:hypothetical protein
MYLVIRNDLRAIIVHIVFRRFMLTWNFLVIEQVIVAEKCELLDSSLTPRNDG